MVVKKEDYLKAQKRKNPVNLSTYRTLCGERGIRTPGTLRYAGFQDRCIRPLYHLSLQMVAVVFGLFASAKVGGFIWIAKFMSYFFRFALKNNGFY